MVTVQGSKKRLFAALSAAAMSVGLAPAAAVAEQPPPSVRIADDPQLTAYLVNSPRSVTAHGCTVTPLDPIYAGRDLHARHQGKFQVRATCEGGLVIRIYQEAYERDIPLPGQLLSPKSYRLKWSKFGPAGGQKTFTFGGDTCGSCSTFHLPDTEPGDEEVYHRVRFTVTKDPVTSGDSDWAYSRLVSMAI